MANELQQGSDQPSVVTEEAQSFFDSVLQATPTIRRKEDQERFSDAVRTFVDQVLQGEIRTDGNLESNIKACIAQIDDLISDQLNETMHDPEFQKLEATWRGLEHLVFGSESSEQLQLRVLNVSKKDLLKDLQNAPEFDQSALFKNVYTAEYSMYGGTPYGFLMGDFEFGNGPEDVALLERISNVAAQAHAPFVAAAAPEMMGLSSFTDLDKPRDLAKIFEGPDYNQWRSFRESEDSRYVALTLPHYLGRLPYGERGTKVDEFNYEENVDGKDHSKYLWCNAAFQYSLRMTDSFAKYGWCTAIRGEEGGGKVEGLPTHVFKTDSGELAQKIPTEVRIDDRREKELSDLGFIALVNSKGRDYASFFSGQTTNKPKRYMDNDANANSDLSAKLPYLMATSRIAHYLKSILRDKVGSFTSRTQIAEYLDRWISNYVLLDDNASQEQKAKRPLREARIEVEEVPGQPGVYQARAWLRPHYQLEAINVSLRLVAKLPAAK